MRRRRRDAPVRAAGIMLPNHSPLVIAEQFDTLESLYRGVSSWAGLGAGIRKDEGADPAAQSHLRPDRFPGPVLELHGIFRAAGCPSNASWRFPEQD